jgi:hypothetical protein
MIDSLRACRTEKSRRTQEIDFTRRCFTIPFRCHVFVMTGTVLPALRSFSISSKGRTVSSSPNAGNRGQRTRHSPLPWSVRAAGKIMRRGRTGRLARALFRRASAIAGLSFAAAQIGAQGLREAVLAFGMVGGHRRTLCHSQPGAASRLDKSARAGHRRGLAGAGLAPRMAMCCRSSVVERILGKAEVVSSILTGSTISLLSINSPRRGALSGDVRAALARVLLGARLSYWRCAGLSGTLQ